MFVVKSRLSVIFCPLKVPNEAPVKTFSKISFLHGSFKTKIQQSFSFFPANGLTKDTFSLKLLSHHCKLLEEYHLDISNAVLTVPPNLKQFCQNTLSLCSGIDPGPICDTENILIELLNEEVVYRSRKCQFATESINTACVECRKFKHLSDFYQIHRPGNYFSKKVQKCFIKSNSKSIS